MTLNRPTCETCIFWNRIQESIFGECAIRKNWQMESHGCSEHLESVLVELEEV